MKRQFLLFTMLLAAASMTFVACAKNEKNETQEAEPTTTEQVTEQVTEPVAEPEISRVEQAVRAVEAATSWEEFMAIDKEYDDLTVDDFTPEQKARVQAVALRLSGE